MKAEHRDALRIFADKLRVFESEWPYCVQISLAKLYHRDDPRSPSAKYLMRDWLDENCQSWAHIGNVFGFKNENDAFAFKMRWL